MPIDDPRRLCDSIIAIDHEIVAVTLLSQLGVEIASSYQPSAALFISNIGEAGQKDAGKLVVAAAEALSHGEEFFGELGEIIVFFKKVKVIITLDKLKQIVVVITATRDAEERHIAFQASKLLSQWS
jgi:hypothetical protein